MKKHGQLLFIFKNLAISRIFYKIFGRICFPECYLLTFSEELYFREKSKKMTKFATINLANNESRGVTSIKKSIKAV